MALPLPGARPESKEIEDVPRRGGVGVGPEGRDKLGFDSNLAPDDVDEIGGETGELAGRKGITIGRRGGPVCQET